MKLRIGMRVRVKGAHELRGFVSHVDDAGKACHVALRGNEWWKEGGTPYLAEELEQDFPGCTCWACVDRKGP